MTPVSGRPACEGPVAVCRGALAHACELLRAEAWWEREAVARVVRTGMARIRGNARCSLASWQKSEVVRSSLPWGGKNTR